MVVLIVLYNLVLYNTERLALIVTRPGPEHEDTGKDMESLLRTVYIHPSEPVILLSNNMYGVYDFTD